MDDSIYKSNNSLHNELLFQFDEKSFENENINNSLIFSINKSFNNSLTLRKSIYNKLIKSKYDINEEYVLYENMTKTYTNIIYNINDNMINNYYI